MISCRPHSSPPRRFISSFLAALLLVYLNPRVCGQSAPTLKIVVLEGEGAINNIRLSRAKEPVVQVQDQTGLTLSGVPVTFLLPSQGAGGLFGDGGTSLNATTDDKGVAVGRGLKPNKTAGQFQIRVIASHQGQTASANITQVNAEPAEARGGSSKTIAILAVVGGVAVGAAVLGLSRNKDARTTPSPPAAAPSPSTVITAGTPSFGPP